MINLEHRPVFGRPDGEKSAAWGRGKRIEGRRGTAVVRAKNCAEDGRRLNSVERLP